MRGRYTRWRLTSVPGRDATESLLHHIPWKCIWEHILVKSHSSVNCVDFRVQMCKFVQFLFQSNWSFTSLSMWIFLTLHKRQRWFQNNLAPIPGTSHLSRVRAKHRSSLVYPRCLPRYPEVHTLQEGKKLSRTISSKLGFRILSLPQKIYIRMFLATPRPKCGVTYFSLWCLRLLGCL